MMKETRVEQFGNLNRAREDDLVVGDVVYRSLLGNFVKVMILYDDRDDGILKYFGRSFSVFYRLLRYVNWDSCLVDGSGANKLSICRDLEIDAPAFEAHLRGYIKINLIKRVSRGVYMVNPCKVFMGEMEEQKKLMIDWERTVGI